jgi:cysteinyl-tRNA synthetase
MSKSLGNIRTMRSFLEEYPAEVFKYLVMSVHYRSESEFSDATIAQSIAGLARIYSALKIAEDYSVEESQLNLQSPALQAFSKSLAQAQANMNEAYDDDFNTSKAFADLFEVVRLFNQKVKPGMKASADVQGAAFLFRQFILQNGQMMALFHQPAQQFLRSLDRMLIRQKNLDESLIENLVAQRWEAKQKKDFSRADELRKRLVEMGIEVRDAASESTWEVIK